MICELITVDLKNSSVPFSSQVLSLHIYCWLQYANLPSPYNSTGMLTAWFRVSCEFLSKHFHRNCISFDTSLMSVTKLYEKQEDLADRNLNVGWTCGVRFIVVLKHQPKGNVLWWKDNFIGVALKCLVLEAHRRLLWLVWNIYRLVALR